MNTKTAETESPAPVRRKSKRSAAVTAPTAGTDAAELGTTEPGTAGPDAAGPVSAPPVATAPPDAEPPGGAATPSLQLEHSLQIKDIEQAHRRLLAALAQGPSMILDMSRLATVDTAGVQLLLSFRLEAAKRGVQVEYRGQSQAFSQALTVLGLRDAFPATVP